MSLFVLYNVDCMICTGLTDGIQPYMVAQSKTKVKLNVVNCQSELKSNKAV